MKHSMAVGKKIMMHNKITRTNKVNALLLLSKYLLYQHAQCL